MARKSLGAPTADSPPVPTDDFSLIKGIGPILSKRLHNAGIYSYNQLESQLPAELAKKIKGLSVKQIAKQGWTNQAHKLARKKTLAKIPPKVTPKRNFHQHYENFTIEFLLDEKNRIRRTRVVHIQSGDAATSPGWGTDQLIDFLARNTGVRIPAKKLEKNKSALTSEQRPVNTHDEPIPIIASAPKPLLPMAGENDLARPSPVIAHMMMESQVNANISGVLHLKDFKILPIDSDTPTHSLRQDQSYHVRLTLDLANVSAPSDAPLRCKTTIIFKQMGGASHLVAEETSIIELSECATLDIICANPQSGLYRPDAFVKLFSDETNLGLMASSKGDLIQIF
jgi:hypothetical protein